MSKKIVLAYSGGLDTSVAIKWLRDKGFDVIACLVDVGQKGDFEKAKSKAKKIGASKIYVVDAKDEFAKEFILPALKADAVYEDKYFLATALSRPLIAKALADVAKKEGARYVSHGCTGKGNDQVRIEVSLEALASGLSVIAPLREWEFKSRNQELAYAKKHNIPVEATKKSPYSLDENLWGVSIECGVLENPSKEPPKDAYQITKDPKNTPAKPLYLTIGFEKGIPKTINGRKYKPVDLISKLSKIGADYGIGRSDMIENRLVGIKSREIYEAPAAYMLHTAHKELEALVLDRELSHFKELIAQKYSELIYYGLWYSPLKKSLDKFIDDTQKRVTGQIRLKLYKGSCTVVGRKSKNSLYKEELATYSEKDTFDHKAAEGFIKIWGLPYRRQS
ncbi:MAG: argininosuccinate synthase [Candidatus Omnitrophica bacterium]|nr:argininosuccinate synthase [Candidatus Omnitrophota bacterium]